MTHFFPSHFFSNLGVKTHTHTRMHTQDIGLNVKFERRGMYTSGYARKSRQSGSWQYSSECLALLLAYKEVIEHVLYARM